MNTRQLGPPHTRLDRFGLALFLVIAVVAPSYLAANEQSRSPGELFLEAGPAVFRIHSSTGGHGTGFLVDEGGLVVTNSHVVGGSQRPSVEISVGIKVPATVVENDVRADIAVLAVNPDAVRGIAPLRLSDASTQKLASVGEEVIAIGFPLNQDRVLTAGIVSRVNDGSIISDVNINPGNSGGPMLNLESEVIGVNTFGDFEGVGPGISGSVPISVVTPVLLRARARNYSVPDLVFLPVVPSVAYPIGGRDWAAARPIEQSVYSLKRTCGKSRSRGGRPRHFGEGGEFTISRIVTRVTTPISIYRLEYLRAKRRAEWKQKRSNEAPPRGDPTDSRLFLASVESDWTEYVGERSAVVMISMRPRLKPTGGSSFSTFMIGTPTSALEYTGDVNDAAVVRNGKSVTPISLKIRPINLSHYYGIPIVDAANYVFMTLRYEDFEPDLDGTKSGEGKDYESEEFIVFVDDARNRKDKCGMKVDRAVQEQIWMDFEPYRDFLAGRTVELQLPREIGR